MMLTSVAVAMLLVAMSCCYALTETDDHRGQLPLSILYHRLSKAKGLDERFDIREEIVKLMKWEDDIEDQVSSIVFLANSLDTNTGQVKNSEVMRRFTLNNGESQYKKTNLDCTEPAVELFNNRCRNFSQHDYAQWMMSFVSANLCEEVPLQKIKQAITRTCG